MITTVVFIDWLIYYYTKHVDFDSCQPAVLLILLNTIQGQSKHHFWYVSNCQGATCFHSTLGSASLVCKPDDKPGAGSKHVATEQSDIQPKLRLYWPWTALDDKHAAFDFFSFYPADPTL
jgi:hypothetical protein